MPFRTYAPQLALLVLSVLSIIWAPIAFATGWVRYPVAAFDAALWMSVVWIGWNIYFAQYVVRLSLRVQQHRSDHRFVDEGPVRVGVRDAEGAEVIQHAWTRDLNPTGMSFRGTTALEPGTNVDIRLPLSTRVIEVAGEVMHVETEQTTHGAVHLHGVRFAELSVQDRDAIEIHCTAHAVPIWRLRYKQSVDLFAKADSRVRDSRSTRRHAVQLPARVALEDPDEADGTTEIGGLLEEVSTDGARLLLERPLAPGTRLRFDVPGTALSGEGTVVFARALDSPMSVRFTIGVKTTKPAKTRRRLLGYGNGGRSARTVARLPEPAVADGN